MKFARNLFMALFAVFLFVTPAVGDLQFAPPYFTVLDSNGDPASGAKAYFYQSGTTTALDTYSDEDLTTANANPVVADSAGRFGPIWLQSQDYKVVIKDSSDVTIKTIDPIKGSITVSGDDFKVVQQSPADMTVSVGTGTLYDLTTKTRVSKTAQTSSAITAPSTNPRIDVIYIDIQSGVIGVTTGTEAASPSVPTIPDGKLPLAQIALATTTTEITDSLITDIRELANIGAPKFLDEDDMASDSAVSVPSQQSVKAYVGSLGLRGYIDGLTLSNDGTDSAHDIDIAAGVATDDGGTTLMSLSSTLIKQIDASWAVGTNQGGLDGTESVTGTPDANTWYHVWLIRRSDTGVVDVLFSESATSPTMPTNYDQKRRIGAVLTDATPAIIAFTQYGDYFEWASSPLDVSVTNLGTSSTNYTLSVPPIAGIGVDLAALADHGAASQQIIIRNPDTTDFAPGAANGANLSVGAGGVEGATHIRVRTDASGQIAARSSAASTTLRVRTIGWIDPRGKNA